jgi:hypothetical protein
MLVRLDRERRKVLGEKMMELANLAYAGLVLGQLLADRFDALAAFLGAILFLALYATAITIMGGGESRCRP